MSVFWLVVVVMLVMACALFIVPALRRQQEEETTRDALNKAFYHHRLTELEQDEEQGVVGERPPLIQELQENLLSDILSQQQQIVIKPIKLWVLAPSVILLLVISLGFYLYTGGLAQVAHWNNVMEKMPGLRNKISNESVHSPSMTIMDVQNLALGLRTDLQQNPNNYQDWLMLGRVGIALNNASIATQAFSRAYQLSPDDPDVKLGYAEVLSRSGEPQDYINSSNILRGMLEHNQGNLRVLDLLAYNEFEQGNYPRAIGIWEMMLKYLPANDKWGEKVKASIEQAKAKSGQGSARLNVHVTLSTSAAKQTPQQGAVFISVTDGISSVPVAVKKLPLSRFPLSLSIDNSNAMMPGQLISSLHRLQVRVRISRSDLATPASGDWYGDSPVTIFPGNGQVNIEINQRIP